MSTMRRREYEAYLASTDWAHKRKARLALDGHRCRLCDEDGTRYTLEVHHRPSSYPLIPHESVLDDLITVCARCHDLITSAIRGDRYSRRTLPSVDDLTEHITLRMEIDHGLGNRAVQVDLIVPADPTQRAHRQPARQVGEVDQGDFVQTRQDRR